MRVTSSGGSTSGDGQAAAGATSTKSSDSLATNAVDSDGDSDGVPPPADGGQDYEGLDNASPSGERDSEDPSAWADDSFGGMAEPGIGSAPMVPQADVPASAPNLPIITVGTPSPGVERHDADLIVVAPLPGVTPGNGVGSTRLERLRARRASLRRALGDIDSQQSRLRDEAKELEDGFR